MAITVSGTNRRGAYYSDFGNIVLHNVPQEQLRIDYTITHAGETLFSFSENYYPDEENQITLRALGDVAAVYFALLPVPSPYTPQGSFGSYAVTISAAIVLADGSAGGSFEQKFYYSAARTNLSEPSTYGGFCSRFSTVKVTPEQWQLAHFLYLGQTVTLHVTYNAGGSEATQEIEIPIEATRDEFVWVSIGPAAVLERLNEATGQEYPMEALFAYYLTLGLDGNTVDTLAYEIDRNHYPQCTYLLYFNSFGLPETLYLTGKVSRTSEMEATFATIDRQYRKFNTKLSTHREVNSGYIDDTMVEAIEDLVKSQVVYLVTDEGVGDMVTVTETTMETEAPKSAPHNVAIKYRVADENMQAFRRGGYESGIFVEAFNETFN